MQSQEQDTKGNHIGAMVFSALTVLGLGLFVLLVTAPDPVGKGWILLVLFASAISAVFTVGNICLFIHICVTNSVRAVSPEVVQPTDCPVRSAN